MRKGCLENLTRTGYNEDKWDRVKQRVIYLTNAYNGLQKSDWRYGKRTNVVKREIVECHDLPSHVDILVWVIFWELYLFKIKINLK